MSYHEDMEEYFAEFLISYIFTQDYGDYSAADTDEKALKLYNTKITRRFFYESLNREAEKIARSPVHKGEPKLIWNALKAKYEGKQRTDIERKLTEWQNITMNSSEQAEAFTERVAWETKGR
jgi:hypothetical protein